MRLRFYLDSRTGLPHICGHDVTELEVEEILNNPAEDRLGTEGARIALGQTEAGRYIRVVYVPDPEPDSVRHHGVYSRRQTSDGVQAASEKEELAMAQAKFPPGWDEERVQRTLAHYETQSEDEALAEGEAAFEKPGQTVMGIPSAFTEACCAKSPAYTTEHTVVHEGYHLAFSIRGKIRRSVRFC